jgi:hypothetical protein
MILTVHREKVLMGLMALTPGEFCKTAAAVLRMPETQVQSAWRYLREADLVSMHGRGPSAAKPTAEDAAILLAALLGSKNLTDAVATVRRYSKAKPWPEFRGDENLFRQVSFAALAELPPDHTFIDALTALIAAAADEKLFAGYDKAHPNTITIVVQNPATIADIRVGPDSRGAGATVRYYAASGGKHRVVSLIGGMEEFRRVNASVLIYLGAALAGKLDELPALSGE